MLRELHISNLAVIEDATVEFGEGLNVFTGETGAGKSLIIGAFELLLGLRSGGAATGAMIRSGCDEGRVVGMFEIRDQRTADEIGAIVDMSLTPDEPLLITRRIFASGRSSVSINGSPGTAGMLRAIGELLVDIHGQHDQQYLLKPANQLKILDSFAKSSPLREKFTLTHRRLRELRQRREELLASQELRRQQTELFEFQAGEIDAAELQPNQASQVQAKFVKLSNVGRLKQDASEICDSLQEADGSVLERLQLIGRELNELTQLDADKLTNISQVLHDATDALQDVAGELNSYADSLDLDDGELTETQQLLDTINYLIHKYAGGKISDDPTGAVLEYRSQIGEKIEAMRGEETDMQHLDAEDAALQLQLGQIGEELTTKRAAAAKKLKPLIESQFKQLGMDEATFDVQIETLESTDAKVGPSGLDAIEFLVRTNPGSNAHPLRQIASGGEVSRIMLGLKSILAGGDRISVLVFDEIDANIGGRLGGVIGEKMRQLAHGATLTPRSKTAKTPPAPPAHQVLCITHLSQIAAYADNHLHISKEVSGPKNSRQTRTTVRLLTGDDRTAELAEMMAGKNYSQTALDQARELLTASSGGK
ncbi:MAG: DNA repair protein RecN [Phycisphaerae bacterium]|nr:DNA repair protein RecN [Phycisphaerae bacterium]